MRTGTQIPFQAARKSRNKFVWRCFMKTRASNLVALTVGVLVLSIPAFAHHGAAAYDTSKTVSVKATITDFQFINPHVLVFFEVRNDDGAVEKWQGELTSPNHLARTGWTRSSLKPGDEVTISGARSKNGSTALWINKVVRSDGQELRLNGGDN
jgi:Family of unknown function (DUF6152)